MSGSTGAAVAHCATCDCMGLQPLPAVAILVECVCVGLALQMVTVVGKNSVWTGSSEPNGIDEGMQALLAAETEFLTQYETYLTSGVATDSFCLQLPCVLPVLDTNTVLLLGVHCCNVTHTLLLQHVHPWWCWVPSRWPS